MRRTIVVAVLLPFVASSSAASDVELSLQVGRVAPYFEQAVRYAPGVLGSSGFSLQLADSIGLDAKGGTSVAGSFAFFPVKAFGIEARVDRAPIEVAVKDARFDLALRVPGLPPLTAGVTGVGSASVDPLTPVSLNLKLRSTGSVRFALSGGVSYLPSFDFEATETLRLASLAGIGLGGPGLSVRAGGAIDSSIGLNGGIGVEIALSKNLALVGEARGFVFEEQTLAWRGTGDRPLSAVDQLLQQELLQKLDPVRFRPGFYQATLGLTLRF